MKIVTSMGFVIIASLFVAYASAQDLQPLEENIDLAEKKSAQQLLDEQFNSSIRVGKAGDSVVKEYQTQGRTYKVVVIPKNTPPYVLTDQDGNGNLNSSGTNLDTDIVVPEWTLGTW